MGSYIREYQGILKSDFIVKGMPFWGSNISKWTKELIEVGRDGEEKEKEFQAKRIKSMKDLRQETLNS